MYEKVKIPRRPRKGTPAYDAYIQDIRDKYGRFDDIQREQVQYLMIVRGMSDHKAILRVAAVREKLQRDETLSSCSARGEEDPQPERWVDGPQDYGTRFKHMEGNRWEIWRHGVRYAHLDHREMCPADQEALAYGLNRENSQDEEPEQSSASTPAEYHENQEILAALKTLAQFTYDSDEEVLIVSRQAGYKFGRAAGYTWAGQDNSREKIYSADWEFRTTAPHDPFPVTPIADTEENYFLWHDEDGNKKDPCKLCGNPAGFDTYGVAYFYGNLVFCSDRCRSAYIQREEATPDIELAGLLAATGTGDVAECVVAPNGYIFKRFDDGEYEVYAPTRLYKRSIMAMPSLLRRSFAYGKREAD